MMTLNQYDLSILRFGITCGTAWVSLKVNPMPHPIQHRNMHAQRGGSDRSMVPKLPEITTNSLARAQRAVHRTNATPLPQANCRDSQQHPSETVDASTHVDHSRTQFL